MAKKVKPVDEVVNTETEVKPVDDKVSSSVEIEITKEVAGMAIGTVKTVPALLAKQMIDSGNAKLKN
jgi:hypothetical protein